MPLSPFCPLCAAGNCSEIPSCAEYFRCGVCDLHFLHPGKRLDAAAEKARYQSHNNNVNDLQYQKFLEPLFHAIRPLIAAGARGLDFGAGPGPALAAMFARAGFPMAIYDPYFWPKTDVLEQTYAFVVSSEVVEHLYAPDREFARLFALLRPGGYLGLMTLLVEPDTDFAAWYYRKDPTHVVFYSRQSLRWITQRFGFAELNFLSESSNSSPAVVINKTY